LIQSAGSVFGSAQLQVSEHEVRLVWGSYCLRASESSSDATQVFSLAIGSVDGRNVQYARPGFTVSFKDAFPPEFLLASENPVDWAQIHRELEQWIDPSPELRIKNPVFEAETTEDQSAPESDADIEKHVEDLRLLEAQLELLQILISDKKKFIHTEFHGDLSRIKEEVHQCDGVLCILKTICRKVRGAARLAYLKFRPNPYLEAVKGQGLGQGGQQKPTMITSINGLPTVPQAPEQCHCSDGKPSEKPKEAEAPQQPPDDSQFRDALPPSKLLVVLRVFFLITGLALIFSFISHCCTSKRRKRDKEERRERRAAERAYKCASKRQAFWDWWYNKKRGTPGRRPGDFVEKRTLVHGQEALLEEHMQDDIRQLQIQEEIRHFRTTTDMVDDIIRQAEEGRLHAPAPPYAAYSPSSSSAGNSSYPAGFVSLPRPIIIPSPRASRPSTADDSNDGSISPVSRTTSLPSYRSKPPSYRSADETDSFSISSGEESTSDDWGSGSSIPDLSPRPSGDTYRTSAGETVRSFV
jgi:hypothetical protein